MSIFDRFKNKGKAKKGTVATDGKDPKLLLGELSAQLNEPTLMRLRNGEINKKDQDLFMKQIDEIGKKSPTHFIYKDNKNMEESLIRNLALSAALKQDYEKAIKYANDGLKINPISPYLLYMKGRSEGDLGKLKDGLDDLNQAIKIAANFSDAYVERGVIKHKMMDDNGAVQDFKIAREIEPSIIIPVFNEPLAKGELAGRGIRIYFVIKPAYPTSEQKGMTYHLIVETGLSKYFTDADVGYYPNYKNSEWMGIKVSANTAKFQLKPSDVTKVYEDFLKQYIERLVKGFDEVKMFKCKLYTIDIVTQLMPPEPIGVIIPPEMLQEPIQKVITYCKTKGYLVSDAEMKKTGTK